MFYKKAWYRTTNNTRGDNSASCTIKKMRKHLKNKSQWHFIANYTDHQFQPVC